jgi:hypothetical protein
MRNPLVRRFVLVVALGGLARSAEAQTCWVYTDNEPAKVPIRCVQKSDPTTACSWPTDCTTVPGPPQTIREMHQVWHQCFGAVGGATPPSGRSQRWYAFHRQFEYDFNIWRRGLGLAPIEQLEWCPGMVLPIGTGPVDPPGPCGDGTPRPAGVTCPECIAFAQCLFLPGGGPSLCPSAPSPNCQTPDGSVSFPFASLDQFPNVDDVAKILDGEFHGRMHGAVADADCPGCYNQDSNGSNCSPRDPMFWRLHHALDDVVRAWQDSKAVDVVVVIDRSGSMSEPDSSGSTKLQAALAALDNFADLLEDGRADGQSNRIGVVSYSNSPTTNLGMTTVNASLRAAGGPFDMAKSAIASAGASGCTGIGPALQRAVELLCPPGDCRGFSAAGDNDRKAILLLTDGVENIAPCLQPAGPSGASCGNQCFGAPFDLEKLEFTQLVAVGFGNTSNLNGPLLTLVAERQGGIYLQNPNAPGDDLKDFFAKAFANLSSEFLMLDPKGTLAPDAAASETVEYNGCSDSMLTFTSGWHQPIPPGDLKLLVTTPSGDLVRAGDPGIEASRQGLWDFSRIRLPYRGAVSGTWRAQLVRPHSAYVNGFAPDAFADPDEGTALVRREIHRLCPEGCKRVLLFESALLRSGASAYRAAVKAEKDAGLLGSVDAANDDDALAKALRAGRFDLVVYAQMDATERRYAYDDPLAGYLCQGGRAILSDARPRTRMPLFRCAGVDAREPVNWQQIHDGDLVVRPIKMVNPGYPIFSHAVGGASLQAFVDRPVAAVAARVQKGVEERWFVDVLGNSLGKLSPHRRNVTWKTGEAPIVSARVLPSYIRSGGWDRVDARVEVEFPRIGEGALLAQRGVREPRKVQGETLDARAAALSGLHVPTATATFPLFDDGSGVDLHPHNGVWTGELRGLGKTDGIYKLRYIFDFTAKGCTTRRELAESIYVDVGVDPRTTKVTNDPKVRDDRWTVNTLHLKPVDRFGNLLGPGRGGAVSCRPAKACKVARDLADDGRGSYTIEVATAPNLASVRVDAFGTAFDVAVPCATCPKLERIAIEPGQVVNLQQAKGLVRLFGKAPSTPAGGAVVYLASDLARVASVPEFVLVPAGQSEATFPVTVFHVHEEPETVTVDATYGGAFRRAKITVSEPEPDPNAPRPVPVPGGHKHQHPD